MIVFIRALGNVYVINNHFSASVCFFDIYSFEPPILPVCRKRSLTPLVTQFTTFTLCVEPIVCKVLDMDEQIIKSYYLSVTIVMVLLTCRISVVSPFLPFKSVSVHRGSSGSST